jgi:TRAP-type transport system periplasmic protein
MLLSIRVVRRAVLLACVPLLVIACAEAENDQAAEPTADDEAEPEAEDEAQPEDEDENENDDEEVVTLQYANHNADTASMSQSAIWMMDEIEQRTEGRVEFEPFFAGSLVGPSEVLPGLNDGRVESAFVAMFYEPSRMPLWQVSGVPFLSDNAEAQVRAFTQLHEEHEGFQTEFDEAGIHVLGFVPMGSSALGMHEPVTSLEQLQGERVRSGGYLGNALAAIGVDAVAMPFDEVYEALQRDAIAGYSATPFDTVVASGLNEVRPDVTHVRSGLFASAVFGVSQEVWDSLPADVQEIMSEVGDEYIEEALNVLADAEAETCDAVLEDGGSVTLLPDEEVEEWIEQIGDEVRDTFVADSASAGVSEEDASEFYDRYVELLEEHEDGADYTDGMVTCANR